MRLQIGDLARREDARAILDVLAADTLAEALERLRRGCAGREQEGN